LTDVLCDTSIVLKWFHEDGEEGVEPARALLEAHRDGALTAWILELTLHELANVLLRALGWDAAAVADQLDDLLAICPVLSPPREVLRDAATLAERHGLTFCDALYAAAAARQDALLVTADEALLGCGLGVSPASVLPPAAT
jgi:predicted nucleic acid-binding protein